MIDRKAQSSDDRREVLINWILQNEERRRGR